MLQITSINDQWFLIVMYDWKSQIANPGSQASLVNSCKNAFVNQNCMSKCA